MLQSSEHFIDKSILVLLILSLIIVPLLYLPYQDKMIMVKTGFDKYTLLRQDNIYKPKIDTLLFLEMILLTIIYFRIKKRGNFFHQDRIYIPIICLYLFFILSTIFSPYKWTAIYGRPYRWEGLLAYTAYILIFLVVANFTYNWQRIRVILKVLLGSAFIISFYGLIQFFGFDFIPRDPLRKGWQGRAFATLGNPNFAGSYIIMFLALVLVFFIFAKRRKNVVIFGSLAAIYYSFLIATFTRSAWLAFLIILPIILIINWGLIKKYWLKVLILFLIFVLITFALDAYRGGYFRKRFMSIFHDAEKLVKGNKEERARAGTNRIFIYIHTLPLLFERPLVGSGLDSFDRVFPQELYHEFTGKRVTVDKAHCEYLQLGVTAGLPALGFYLIFLLILIMRGWRNLEKKNKFQIALYVAFLSYIFQATFNISVVSVAPVFWGILGLNLAVNKIIAGEY